MTVTGSMAALGATLAIFFAAGCGSSLPDTELPPTRLVSPALEFPALRDYRGVIDCKMRQSGFDQARLADLAILGQIDFIFLGDLSQGAGTDIGIAGFTAQVLFIPGASFPAASGGEIVGLNLQHPIAQTRASADLIARIHEQGGLALAADPTRLAIADYAQADAMEVYNQQSVWDEQGPLSLYLRSIFLTGDHLFRTLDLRPDANLAAYDRMVSGARVTLVAGVGVAPQAKVMGTRVGTFEQLFGVCATHLLAPERGADPIVDALKYGHAYVSFDFLGYVENFAFFAQSGDQKVMMGDQISMAPGLKLKVEMPLAADRVVILSGGSEAASAQDVTNFEFAPKGPGAYRVEAYRAGLPWIYSNPVYVR